MLVTIRLAAAPRKMLFPHPIHRFEIGSIPTCFSFPGTSSFHGRSIFNLRLGLFFRRNFHAGDRTSGYLGPAESNSDQLRPEFLWRWIRAASTRSGFARVRQTPSRLRHGRHGQRQTSHPGQKTDPGYWAFNGLALQVPNPCDSQMGNR